MAKVSFENIRVSAMVTTIGDQKLEIDEEKETFGFDDKTLRRLKKTIGLGSRHVASDGTCTSDLCYQSARRILDHAGVDRDAIEGVLLVTQSPDYRAPSTAIILQDRLGLTQNVVAYDINLGCSGFVFGLFTAHSFIQSGLNKVLLLVGDVNRYFTARDKTLTPLMGDAGSAILIERGGGEKSHFVLHSDGSGSQHLIIPAGGAREECSPESLKFILRKDGGLRRDCDLYMNGGEVFNFAVRTVPPLLEELFEFGEFSKDETDYFVLHQANRYILKNIAAKLNVTADRLPMETATIYGNQNGASIPGTINAFLSEEYSQKRLRSVFSGFGIGLSWGACSVITDQIYAPQVEAYRPEHRSYSLPPNAEPADEG